MEAAPNTDFDTQITELVVRIRADQHLIVQTLRQLQKARQELCSLLRARGAPWTDAQGFARLMAQETRFSYDTETLDTLLASDPIRYGWLKDLRREKQVRERVQVK